MDAFLDGLLREIRGERPQNDVLSWRDEREVRAVHELSIARSVLDLVTHHVPADQHALIRTVRMRIGALAGVAGSALAFSFEALTHDTDLSQARIEIVNVPVTVHCSACRRASAIEFPSFVCPRCGGTAVRLCSGDELHLDEIVLALH